MKIKNALSALVVILIGANLNADRPGDMRHGGGHSGGWTFCAIENATCNVMGPVQVRFGNQGRYTYMDTNSPVPCTWAVMGDPAVGDPNKVCEYRPASASNTQGTPLSKCANEGGVCRNVPRGTYVSYGANGRYYEVVSNGREIPCNNSYFGDPAPNFQKECFIGKVPMVSLRRTEARWVFCAGENGPCQLPRRGGAFTVRFGQNGSNGGPARFVTKDGVRGSIPCANQVFGDPFPGQPKVCQYLE